MDLKSKTINKLKSELQLYKVLNYMLMTIIVLVITVCVYGIIVKEENSTFVILITSVLCTGGVIPLNYSNIKKIKKELELRK